MSSLDGELRRLEALRDSYPRDPDYGRASSERKGLLERINHGLAGLREDLKQFDDMLCERDSAAVASAVTAARGPDNPAEKPLGQARMRDSHVFSKRCSRFIESAEEVVLSEEASFQILAKTRSERRRRGPAIALVAVAFILLALVVAARRSGSPAHPKVVEPMPAAPKMERPVRASPPAVVGGRWKIRLALGMDPLGDLFEGTAVAEERKALMRRVRPEILQSGRDFEEFLLEARRGVELKHPHIVDLYEVLREAGECWLVMEPDMDVPLTTRLGPDKAISLAVAKTLILQVSSALAYAHSRKILHKDLKPANIRITSEGAAKLADFGVSHWARIAVRKSVRDEPWDSEPYMAPECFIGLFGEESDVYALGAVFYEMLTGLKVFPGPEYAEQKQALLFSTASEIVKGLPPEADHVILKALMIEPKDRFRKVGEFMKAVSALSDLAAP
jgi:serine/threonine protein kinase